MKIEIPGYKTLILDYLVLDYNGTIARTSGKDSHVPFGRRRACQERDSGGAWSREVCMCGKRPE